jgi:hypothetical protein
MNGKLAKKIRKMATSKKEAKEFKQLVKKLQREHIYTSPVMATPGTRP